MDEYIEKDYVEYLLRYYGGMETFSKDEVVSACLQSLARETPVNVQRAVKKQIPKKPVIPWDSMSGDYVCPICLSGFLGNQPYCSNCGQAIDWSKMDAEG